MKMTNILVMLVVALLVGKFSLCSACDGDCHWDEVTKVAPAEVKEEVEVEVKEEPVAVVADNTKATDDEEEEKFDPEAFAKFAQRLKDGDVDTTVRVVDEKDTV